MKTNKANYTQPPVDMMALGFTGVAGFNNWPGYQLDLNYNYEHFWKPLLRVQNHLNGDDVINILSEGGGKWGVGCKGKKSVGKK